MLSGLTRGTVKTLMNKVDSTCALATAITCVPNSPPPPPRNMVLHNGDVYSVADAPIGTGSIGSRSRDPRVPLYTSVSLLCTPSAPDPTPTPVELWLLAVSGIASGIPSPSHGSGTLHAVWARQGEPPTAAAAAHGLQSCRCAFPNPPSRAAVHGWPSGDALWCHAHIPYGSSPWDARWNGNPISGKETDSLVYYLHPSEGVVSRLTIPHIPALV